MSNDDSDVLIYAPFKKENLDDKEISWLDSFQSILKVGLQQITKQKIQISSSYLDKSILNKDYKILVTIILNPDFEKEIIEKKDIGVKKIIQVNCHPEIESKISKDGIIVNLFDESKNKTIDISGNINELKNETWLKFLDIAYEIRSTIYSQTKERSIKGKIFIAETSSEQNVNRETIIRELEHLGYKVLPEKHFPRDMVSFSELVQSNMRECFLSVHIIGNFYAPLLENIDISSIELQNDLFHEVAAELSANNQIIKRLVWIPPDIKPKSEKQKLYIESFKRNIELLKNTEIVQTPIEVFKTIIKEKAEEILKKQEVKKEEKKDDLSVYLISNNIESDNYKKIKEQLIKQKLEVLEIKDSNDKIDLIQNHYFNLIQCDALLIDYSIENYQWLNSKLSDIVKSPGFGRKGEFLAKSVIVNTAKSPEINLRINNLDLIDNQKEDINRRLASFIEKINQK